MNNYQNTLENRRNCTLTTEPIHKGLAINTNKEKEQSCIKEILDPLHAHLADMTGKHSKVLCTRFDIRTPQGTEGLTNKQIGRIFENITRAINRENYSGGHDPDPRLIGVAEDQGHGTHYHCVAMVNANAIQNQYKIFSKAEKYLGKALDLSPEETKGLVHYCNTQGTNGNIIKRGSADEEEKTHQVMHQISYLATKRGKENTPKGQHLWVGTRVPKKQAK